mgnify:CR=1 FL=1
MSDDWLLGDSSRGSLPSRDARTSGALAALRAPRPWEAEARRVKASVRDVWDPDCTLASVCAWVSGRQVSLRHWEWRMASLAYCLFLDAVALHGWGGRWEIRA